MNYLALISRPDFINLYKFGHLNIPNLVPYDGNLKDHANDRALFGVVTKYINPYEYDTEYILLNIYKDVSTDVIVEVSISEVQDLYVLSAKAKQSLKVSLDPRINIQISYWEPFFSELSVNQAIRQAKKGVYNCYKIFGISKDEIAKINEVIPSNLIEEVYNDAFSGVRPSNNASLWNYLIRYERHSPYWHDKRGFFSDAVHVYENLRNGEEIDNEIADLLSIGQVIDECDPKNFNEIVNKLEAFCNNDYSVSSCRYFVVAPLYLFLKAEFRDGISASKIDKNKNIISYLHNTYKTDFAIAIALLGISLGQDLTYNYFYELDNLGIFSSDDKLKVCSLEELSPNVIKEMSEKIEDLKSLLHSRDKEIIVLNDNIIELKNKLGQAFIMKETVSTSIEEENDGATNNLCNEELPTTDLDNENHPHVNSDIEELTLTSTEVESNSFEQSLETDVCFKPYTVEPTQNEGYCVEESQAAYVPPMKDKGVNPPDKQLTEAFYSVESHTFVTDEAVATSIEEENDVATNNLCNEELPTTDTDNENHPHVNSDIEELTLTSTEVESNSFEQSLETDVCSNPDSEDPTTNEGYCVEESQTMYVPSLTDEGVNPSDKQLTASFYSVERHTFVTEEVVSTSTEEEQDGTTKNLYKEELPTTYTNNDNHPHLNSDKEELTMTATEVGSSSLEQRLETDVCSKPYTVDPAPNEGVCIEESQVAYAPPLTDEGVNPSDKQLNASFYPVEMRKLKKDRKSFNTKSNSKWAHDKEEYDKLIDKNYAPINFFDEGSMFSNQI